MDVFHRQFDMFYVNKLNFYVYIMKFMLRKFYYFNNLILTERGSVRIY